MKINIGGLKMPSFYELRDVAEIISNYAIEYGLPQPAAIKQNYWLAFSSTM